MGCFKSVADLPNRSAEEGIFGHGPFFIARCGSIVKSEIFQNLSRCSPLHISSVDKSSWQNKGEKNTIFPLENLNFFISLAFFRGAHRGATKFLSFGLLNMNTS